MKKRIALALALCLVLALTACGKEAPKDQNLLAQIQAKGEITIATEGTWAPWTFHDESGALVGFEIGRAHV